MVLRVWGLDSVGLGVYEFKGLGAEGLSNLESIGGTRFLFAVWSFLLLVPSTPTQAGR